MVAKTLLCFMTECVAEAISKLIFHIGMQRIQSRLRRSRRRQYRTELESRTLRYARKNLLTDLTEVVTKKKG